MTLSQEKNQLAEIKFYRQDPLAKLLLDKLNLNPSRIVVLFLSIIVISRTIFRLKFSFTIEAITLEVWRFILYPLIGGYYLWASNSMANLLSDLARNSIVEISEDDWNLANKIYRKFWWKYYLSIVFAAITCILFIASRFNERRWIESAPLELLKSLGAVLGSYMASMTIIVLVINAWLIGYIFKPKVLDIEPLNADGCGGLKPLNQYSLKTAYIIASFGLIIGLVEYRFIVREIADDFGFIHLGIPIYIGLSLAAFFYPLMAAHLKMLDTKSSILNKISKQFQEEYRKLMSLGVDVNNETLNQAIEKVKQLDLIYERTKKFPVWPYDTQALQKYLLSLITPLIPPLIALLQKVMEALLKKWGIIS